MDNNGSARRRNPNGQAASGNRQAPPNRRPSGPRRRRRSKMQKFKEAYLPVLLLALAVILIATVIITLVISSKNRKEAALAESIMAANSERAYQLQLETEAQSLILQAEELAAGFNYDGAIAILDSFSGDIYEFDDLISKRNEYLALKEALVAWDDPSKVVSLSMHHLVVEPSRAFSHETYKNTIKYNFLTVDEFTAMLQSLYDNGFILISMDDIIAEEAAADGSVTYKAKTLYLPAGKKPLMLIQTHNAPSYVFDNDGDGEPDCGCGFASRLLVNNSGELTCEYTDRKNSTTTGNYDLVPILEDFIVEHPDFSYMGARATIAVTGRYFLFGYQTNPSLRTSKGLEYYNYQVAQATAVADKLKELGYEFACYTYSNRRYGNMDIAEIQEDLNAWKSEVEPILGSVDTFVFALDSDIAPTTEAYTGSKFEALTNAGFRYFIGFCDDSDPWMTIEGSYVRQGRITVNGNKLISDPGLYEDIFDAVSIKDEYR